MIAFAKESDVYDTFVINEDVDRAIAEAIEKVAQARTAQGK